VFESTDRNSPQNPSALKRASPKNVYLNL